MAICGENVTESRKYWVQLQAEHKKKGNYVELLAAKNIEEVYKENNASISLFGQKKVYFTENLSRLMGRAKDKKNTVIKDLVENSDIEIYDWEEGKSSRDFSSKAFSSIKEFKADTSIFQLLDSMYPGNRKNFILLLNKVLETQDEQFVFLMLSKTVRSLVLASKDVFSPSVQNWQRAKISVQTSRWSPDKLILLYESLSRIDMATKTSSNVYSMRKSLELLAIYYL